MSAATPLYTCACGREREADGSCDHCIDTFVTQQAGYAYHEGGGANVDPVRWLWAALLSEPLHMGTVAALLPAFRRALAVVVAENEPLPEPEQDNRDAYGDIRPF